MSDPFDNYEELRSYLSDIPLTWYPDLIRALVEAAYKKKVFVEKRASRFVEKVEKELEAKGK
jgi:hypothetical protein